MKNKKNNFSAKIKALFALMVFLFGSTLTFALTTETEPASNSAIEEEFLAVYKQRFSDRLAEGRDRLTAIKKALDDEYTKFGESLKTSQEIEKKLLETRNKLTDLKEQLENINLQLTDTSQKIEAIESQIYKRKIDLEILYEEKDRTEAEAEGQKKVVLNYFKLLQKENAIIGDDEVKNTMRLLIADASFSTHLRNEMYLSAWEKTEREVFHNMEAAIAQMEETVKVINEEKQRLEQLNEKLVEEKYALSVQKTAKENLIQETRGQQEEYRRLWEQSRTQMSDSANSIQDLRTNMDAIREKLNVLEAQKRAALMENGAKNESTSLVDEAVFAVGEIFQNEDERVVLSWPVDASRGITAYYHDESYKAAFSMTHEAIDIRAAQGTPIKAPALGYVYKTVDNGMGYSYIILAHRNNISTVFGHISEIMVKEGDMVQEGDIIGLSGGTPGTKGAGVITTGPHLHFEVFEDGEHKNPLDFLPLQELPIEYVPEEYIDKKTF